MPDIPPPVPPEIVRRFAEEFFLTDDLGTWQLQAAEESLAAVYGDIVEAARRDALTEAIEAIKDEALRASRISAIRAVQIRSAARIVTDLRDATAPPRAPTASVSDQGADPRTPGTDEAQIGVQSDD